ncbi:thiamine phosphate synthase [Clostridium tagluense]|uniref:thiamine phosphate synthase n=1 Tax=Clostridium tagluense TaxID=360422 RepID=UPI001CF10F1C|nr:thiamine phosphate synthase [Clostridium tagluense]MCB2312902.1 thiamine phosphate synthase [Clostridium tagluense]MCB2317668.1 thiamine phosphate synthase [Clostridium tagluense]MCB2322498.1 thiamine phosphate synthase [Clostridium tagluense]MCB2327500.1 thiamine phosphate synthase [Clostridium tagluense]MCB2332219.1 thiamine phosphate synthase [Clostridium tagluense]
MLYLITNRNLAYNKDFYNIINEAINGGISAIILREKDLSSAELLIMAKKVIKVIGSRDVKLIINSNLKVAKEVEAFGFHLSFEKFIETKLSFKGIIGVSVHSLYEAIEAEKRGADYLLLGHIFQTDCKKGLPPRGIELIKTIKQNVTIPVIALGGIKPENILKVMQSGAGGAAIMSTIMQAKDPYTVTKQYVDKIMAFV